MITKSPTIKNLFSKNIYFTKSARVAFSYILRSIEFSNNDKLLIPTYIGYTDKEGSGVLDPICENNINYIFYPIKKNFNVDLKILEDLLKTNHIKAMLLIHYFGFLHCDIVKIKRICKRYKVLLIEDCAHTLYTKYKNKNLGDFGDFSFYSLHKVLPTSEGGCFRINNKHYQNINTTLNIKDRASYETLEILLNYDKKIAQKKVIANYNYMVKQLKDIKELKIIYSKLPKKTFPLNLPVFVRGMKREEFYFKMVDEGIVLIALYYRLIDSIKKEAFPNSFYISENIINFPINQDINFQDIDLMINATKKIFWGKNEY